MLLFAHSVIVRIQLAIMVQKKALKALYSDNTIVTTKGIKGISKGI